MEVLVYMALGVLIAPYFLMAVASVKMHLDYLKSQSK